MFEDTDNSANSVLITDCIWLGNGVTPKSSTKFSDQAYQLKWKSLLGDLKNNPNLLVFQRILFQGLLRSDTKNADSIGEAVKAKGAILRYLMENRNLIELFSGIEIDATRNIRLHEPESRQKLMARLEEIISLIKNIFSDDFLISVRINSKEKLLYPHILQSELMKNLAYIHLDGAKRDDTIGISTDKGFFLWKGSDGDTFISRNQVLKLYRFHDIQSHMDTADIIYLVTHSSPLTLICPNNTSSKASASGPYRRTRPPFSVRTEVLKSSVSSDSVPTYFSNIINNLRTPQNIKTSDSSSTRLWGYIILISTWTIFIFGMGSMLGIWEWVFSVEGAVAKNREIYNAQEFPIKEYFPSLVFLMGVVAWAWCIVSWMGMKFFRHAKGGQEP